MTTITDFKTKAEKAIMHLKSELTKIRTGRATPALVENIIVECYDSKSPLVQLATITAPDPRSLLIQAWDKSILKNIEKAIQTSKLGLQPVNEGQLIRLSIPPLTEEKRKELIKNVHERLEEARISIRSIRENILKELRKEEKEKTISEDQFFLTQKQLQKETEQIMNQLQEIAEKKEKEILTI